MGTIVLRDGVIFDGHSPELLDGADVLIEDGEIKEVSERPLKTASAQEIRLDGRFLMPGLIDAHFHAYAAHVNLASLDDWPMSLLSQHARTLLEDALQRGFTSVRDAAGADFGLAAAVEQGLIKGPRLFFSGRALSQTGGHGDTRPVKHFEPCACGFQGRLSQVADGVDAVRRAAREELRKGAHQIKIMATGGLSSPTDPVWMLQYSDEEIRAAVEEAASRRTYVMAHAYTAEAIARVVKLGVRSIEHANLIDQPTAALVAQHGAYVVPTLVTYETLGELGKELGLPEGNIVKLKEIQTAGLTSLERCQAAGIKLGYGTDLLGSLHAQQCREFLIRREVLSPIDILRSATTINAEILNQSGKLGTVAPGAYADLVVFDGNPLEDLGVLQPESGGPRLVMKAGAIYKNSL